VERLQKIDRIRDAKKIIEAKTENTKLNTKMQHLMP